MDNLLIGNGLNHTNSQNEFLKPHKIAQRFKKNLIIYWNLIEKLIYQDNIDVNLILNELDYNRGIEEIAGMVFEFLYNEIVKSGKFNWNYCYRLVEILGEISLKSIFFNDELMIPQITSEYISVINQNYDNIFSLNYIEDWDINGKVNYLHGNLKRYLKGSMDIGSSILSNNEDYIRFKTKEYAKVNFLDVIFMPTNSIVDKYNYVGEGLYPRKCGLELYPADDLFPYDGRNIYSKLEGIKELEIFGMSPHGDKAIIDKIKKIPRVKIYVYNLDKKEIKKWKSFGINAEYIDSKEFLNR